MEPHPLVHFDDSWSTDQQAPIRAAVEAIEPLDGSSSAPNPMLGAPWVATQEPLDEITLYMAHRLDLDRVLIACSVDDLATKIRALNADASETETLFQLMYESTPARSITSDDLRDILDTARPKNEEFEITGLLLYKTDRFMQVIEGPEAAVRTLYANIRADDRHTNVKTLLTTSIRQRTFADWRMGFEDLSALDGADLEGTSTYLQNASLNVEHKPLSDVLTALRRFRDG